MASTENLIHFQDMPPEKHQAISSKGGKASAESRKRKKTMKQLMDLLLSLPADAEPDIGILTAAGIDPEALAQIGVDATNMLVVCAAVLTQAKMGDIQSVKELRSITQDDPMIKHRIKHDNAMLKLAKEKAAPDKQGEDISQINISIQPAIAENGEYEE